MPKPPPHKGRASLSNRNGRYEQHSREAIDDGWEAYERDQPGLPTQILLDTSKTLINYIQSPDLPFDRSINPYRGCEHGCIYCFARPSHAYLGLSPGLDFESKILVKPDAAVLLRAELARRNYRCAPIALGTNTDPYQPLERQQGIMRQILHVLLETRHPLTIVSKSALIERDLDLLSELAQQQLVAVAISITSLDRKMARTLEPRAAAPQRRLQTVTALAQAGVPVSVFIAPVIPFLNDHELEHIAQAAQQAGAHSIQYILLRLPMEVAELFEEWLHRHYPLKAEHIMNRIRDSRGGKDYDPSFHQRMTGNGHFAQLIKQRFQLICKRLGLQTQMPPLRSDLFRKPSPGGQMSLEDFL
jgi:DNA repair photolyase